MTDDGDLERVTEADYAELERDRARASASVSVANRRERVGQTGPVPIQSQDEIAPTPPEAPAGLPRYQPPPVVVTQSGNEWRVVLHGNRLDVAGADRAGRECVRQLLEKARLDFFAGQAWREVLRLRGLLTGANEKVAEARKALDTAKAQHQQAASDGRGDPAKLWKQVLTLRDAWNGHAAAAAAVTGQLKATELKALEELTRRVGEARHSAAEDIAGCKRRLLEDLLAAVKPSPRPAPFSPEVPPMQQDEVTVSEASDAPAPAPLLRLDWQACRGFDQAGQVLGSPADPHATVLTLAFVMPRSVPAALPEVADEEAHGRKGNEMRKKIAAAVESAVSELFAHEAALQAHGDQLERARQRRAY
jgi:hypothetical protein